MLNVPVMCHNDVYQQVNSRLEQKVAASLVALRNDTNGGEGGKEGGKEGCLPVMCHKNINE